MVPEDYDGSGTDQPDYYDDVTTPASNKGDNETTKQPGSVQDGASTPAPGGSTGRPRKPAGTCGSIRPCLP